MKANNRIDKIKKNYGLKFGTTMNNIWTKRHFKLWNSFVTNEIVNWVYVLPIAALRIFLRLKSLAFIYACPEQCKNKAEWSFQKLSKLYLYSRDGNLSGMAIRQKTLDFGFFADSLCRGFGSGFCWFLRMRIRIIN